uniref:Uncharacterized protein n=1 Tax=Arion vulgaris TaxID=1028688 RepID=A0A0B7BKR1_9EUPU
MLSDVYVLFWKIILEGMMPGRRMRGIPRRRWEQDVTEDLRMADAEQLAQNGVFQNCVTRARFRKG